MWFDLEVQSVNPAREERDSIIFLDSTCTDESLHLINPVFDFHNGRTTENSHRARRERTHLLRKLLIVQKRRCALRLFFVSAPTEVTEYFHKQPVLLREATLRSRRGRDVSQGRRKYSRRNRSRRSRRCRNKKTDGTRVEGSEADGSGANRIGADGGADALPIEFLVNLTS